MKHTPFEENSRSAGEWVPRRLWQRRFVTHWQSPCVRR